MYVFPLEVNQQYDYNLLMSQFEIFAETMDMAINTQSNFSDSFVKKMHGYFSNCYLSTQNIPVVGVWF